MKYLIIIHYLILTHYALGEWYDSNVDASKRCFCQLKGTIDDCSCSVETIDSYNNVKIYPRLQSLLVKDYFKYWKVNLNKGCPFFENDVRCSISFCSVQPCDDVPEGIRQKESKSGKQQQQQHHYLKSHMTDNDCDDELGALDTTLSVESKAEFERWAAHDSAQDDSFCYLDDESSADSQYVDLTLNPERYTGYKGDSAHRIWQIIYQENCFKPPGNVGPYADMGIGDMCLEKRTFYRAVSGLHTSINVHLAANYYLEDRSQLEGVSKGLWIYNLKEFQNRFDPEKTYGAGPTRLKNLYFLYLLELRALAKASSYLENYTFYTGDPEEDADVNQAVKEILLIARSFPEHFDESSLFTGGQQALKLKEEFRLHFKNISRIMDCVGCDKCRLWGKLQITGLGTALKILFSPNSLLESPHLSGSSLQLTRNEVVALFNAFGRISNSVYHLENFRRLAEK